MGAAARSRTILDHARLMVERHGDRGVVLMRKHFSWYFKGAPNAKELREKLMKISTLNELEAVLSVLPQPAVLL